MTDPNSELPYIDPAQEWDQAKEILTMPSTQDLFASTLAAYQAFGPLHELTLTAQAGVASASLAAAKMVSDAQAGLDQAKAAQAAAQAVLDKEFSALGLSIQGDEGPPSAPAQ